MRVFEWVCPQKIDEKFDLIFCADVLEHISNDKEMVAWMHEHLKDGGYVLLTVPAHQFLWSEMDDVVEHYRRYNRSNFSKLFQEKFNIIKLSYYNMWLFPVKLVFTIFSRVKKLLFPKKQKHSYNDLPPKLINKIFEKILSSEAALIKNVNLSVGISLIMLARKK